MDAYSALSEDYVKNYKSDDDDPYTALAKNYLNTKTTPDRQASKNISDVSDLLDRMRGGESQQESTNNYQVTPNSRTGAIGKFQVMPANIPSWTKQHYGRALTPQQFQSNPKAQDAVFNGQMGDYLKKAQATSPNDDIAIRKAAAMWYGGEGRSNQYDNPKRFRPDEPSFREYTTSVLRNSQVENPYITLAKDYLAPKEQDPYEALAQNYLADNKGGQPLSPTVATPQNVSVPLPQPETNLIQPNVITPPAATAPPITPQVPVTMPQTARQAILPKGVGSRPVIGQDIPDDAVVTKDGGYVQFPRVVGKENDNLNATAGVYTPPVTETSPETALHNALLSAGESRGLTPAMADKFIADTKAQYGSVTNDPIFKKWKPGMGITVTLNNLVQAGLNPEDVKTQNRQEQVQNPVDVPNLSVPETHINPIQDAADWTNKNADPITANIASVIAGGAATYDTYMAGVLKTINDLSPTKGQSMAEAPGSKQTSENDLTRFADYLQKVGTAGQEFQQEAGAQSETAQTLKGIVGGLAGLPRLVLLPGGPIVNFAVDQAAMTRGAGGSSMDELKAGFEGAGLGALSEFVGPFVGKLASKVNPLLKPVAELATVGGGTYALSSAVGDKSPIANTAVMTVFHTIGMIGRARAEGKVFEAKDGDGNDIKMQVQGDKIVQVADDATPDIKIAIPKFQSTEGKDVVNQAAKLKAATVSPEDLQKTIDEAKNVTTNGSGESSASQEAINRQASEQSKGVSRVVVDTRKPNAEPHPLIGADAVDYVPKPYESVEFRGGDRNGEIIAQGDKVSAAYSPPERVSEEEQPLTKNERQMKVDRFKELLQQTKPLAEKANLTKEEGGTFQVLSRKMNSLRFDLAKPLTIDKIPSMQERHSTLPSSIVLTARNDLMSNKDVWTPIVDAAMGSEFNADTAIDKVMEGKNPKVTPQQFYDTFQATRDALRAKFGDTMKLFRAVGKQKEKATTNWATTKEYAKQFGKNVISKEVPIDNILAVNVGPKGNYHEIIVGEPPKSATMQSEGATNTPEPKTNSSVKETNMAETSLPKQEQANKPINMGNEDTWKPIPSAPAKTIREFLGNRRSGVVGTLHDSDTGKTLTLSLQPDTSSMGDYSIVISDGKASQSRRMKYPAGKNIPDALGHFEWYMNTDNEGRFTVSPKEVTERIAKPIVEKSIDEIKLDKLKSLKYKTANQEKQIEILERQIAANPDKWKVGDGVSYEVASGGKSKQINRGFRIVGIDKENKRALVRSVADTGLTTTGGDFDKVHDQWLNLGELKRDNKYNKGEQESLPKEAPQQNTREPKFTDMTDEDLMSYYHKLRSNYHANPSDALDNRIEVVGNELARRADLPDNVAWGTRGDRTNTERPTGETLNPKEAPQQQAEVKPNEMPEEPNLPKGYGESNTLVTRDKYQEARDLLSKKLKESGRTASAGVPLDPETLKAGAKVAAFHIEAGARRFADFSKAMIDDLGEAIKPHLEDLYNAAKDKYKDLATEKQTINLKPIEPKEKPRGLAQTLEAAQLETGTKTTYIPEKIPTDKTAGERVIAEKGIEGAKEFVRNGNGIEWASTGFAVMEHQKAEIARVRETDPAKADELYKEHQEFVNEFTKGATERGQSGAGVRAVEEFAPDRMEYYLNKVAQKAGRKGLSEEESNYITKIGKELQRLKSRQVGIDAQNEEFNKQTESKAKPKKTETYIDKLEKASQDAKNEIMTRLGKLDLQGLTKEKQFEGQKGAIGEKKPLAGDGELIARYAAGQLHKAESIDALNKDIITTFGKEVEPYLPEIRRRAYELRQEARIAELESKDTTKEQRTSVVQDIKKEIQEANKAVKDANKTQVQNENSSRAQILKEQKAEARQQLKQARQKQAAKDKAIADEAKQRVKDLAKEYQAAKVAERKGYQEAIRAKKQADKVAGFWDTPVRNMATEARARLQNADINNPDTMTDLASVGAEKFLRDKPGGVPGRGAISPTQFYREMQAEFPDLVTNKNRGEVLKQSYQRVTDVANAARDAAKLASASKVVQDVWKEQGIDTNQQAVLIQKAQIAREQMENRSAAAREFNRVSKPAWQRALIQIKDAPRSMMASLNIHQGRQGLFTLLTHPIKISAKVSLPATIKGFRASEADFPRLTQELKDSPGFELGQQAGLNMAELPKTTTNLKGQVEEDELRGNITMKLPWVRKSTQGFVLGMNAERLALFNQWASIGESKGYTFENNPEFFKQAANVANDFTGRGIAPEGIEKVLSNPLVKETFFAPRLKVSQIKAVNDLFNPFNYFGKHAYEPEMRKIMAKNVLRTVAGTAALYTTLIAMGGKGTDDPDDPDFFKVTFGHTHYDLTGGAGATFQFAYKFMRSLGGYLAGEKQNEYQQPLSIAESFFRKKLGPWPGSALDFITGKNAVGQPANLKVSTDIPKMMKENIALKMVLPMIVNEITDGLEDDGWRGVAKTAPASLFGISEQTYVPKAYPKPIATDVRSGKISTSDAQKTLDDKLKSGEITRKQYQAQSKSITEDATLAKAKALHAVKDDDFTNIETFLNSIADKDKAEVKRAMEAKIHNKYKDGSVKSINDAKKLTDIASKYLGTLNVVPMAPRVSTVKRVPRYAP